MSDTPRHAHLDAQADRFNAQAATYSDHHGNPLAQQYRDEFIRAHAFRNGLDGLDVLDAMCGSGEETGFLIANGANVQGVDISSAFAARYADRWGRPCATASITETGFPDESFDLVYVCGGLHHIRPLLSEAIDEIHRVLRPGGHFVFVEPNHDSWSDRLRRIWYRLDKRFGDDEAAVSVDDDLRPIFGDRFEEEVVRQGGNVAYILLAQSFIVRTPEAVRRRLVPALTWFERTVHGTPLDPKFFVCGRFRKTPSPEA